MTVFRDGRNLRARFDFYRIANLALPIVFESEIFENSQIFAYFSKA